MFKNCKFISAALIIVFVFSCMCFVGYAENDSDENSATTAHIARTSEAQPTANSTKVRDTLPLQTEKEETREATTKKATEKATQKPKETEAKTYNNNNGKVTERDYDYDDYTRYSTKDNNSYSKTVKSVKATTTAKPTTEKKIVDDYGRKYRVVKWISLIIMIVSAGALVLINVKNHIDNPKPPKSKTPKSKTRTDKRSSGSKRPPNRRI